MGFVAQTMNCKASAQVNQDLTCDSCCWGFDGLQAEKPTCLPMYITSPCPQISTSCSRREFQGTYFMLSVALWSKFAGGPERAASSFPHTETLFLFLIWHAFSVMGVMGRCHSFLSQLHQHLASLSLTATLRDSGCYRLWGMLVYQLRRRDVWEFHHLRKKDRKMEVVFSI